jgi:hypothetical protein
MEATPRFVRRVVILVKGEPPPTGRTSCRAACRKCLCAASATAVQSQRLVLKMANRTTAAQIMITPEAMKPARSPNPG